MDTDNQLLQSYAVHGSEAAFRELVQRHINLVHSAALRESRGDVSLAEDITQAVFTEVARRAGSLARHPAVSGWLYTAVRRMTANVRRSDQRRQRREQEAFTMNELLSADPADSLWQQVRPALDDVMHELNDADRTAVVLRYFEGRSLKEVGLSLGLNENAARMRIDRALDRLRQSLERRGVKSSVAALAAVLATGAVSATPASLATTVAGTALATAATPTSAALVLSKLVTLPKVAAVASVLLLAAGLLVWRQGNSGRTGSPSIGASANGVADDATPGEARPGQDSSTLAATPTVAAAGMWLQIVEAETGRPLPDVKLHLAYFREVGKSKVLKRVTDRKGKAIIDALDETYHSLNLFATADGHVPKVTTFQSGQKLPADYLMKLEQGVKVGGVVVDEAGKPIADASVELDGPSNDMASQENIQFGPDTIQRTDLEGRWACNMVPRDLDKLELAITHPDHAPTQASVRPNTPEATNLVVTMSNGVTVAGIVLDPGGNPIEGARVREVRMNSEGELVRATDSSGQFEFKNMKPGELLLAVQARRFAPTVQTLSVAPGLGPIRFELAAGELLRLLVTDETGQPISNALAATQSDPMAIRKVEWSDKTDAEGRLTWDSAPADPLAFSIRAEGFNPAYDLKLQADGSEQTIKLPRKQPAREMVQIDGLVTDADSGRPVETFSVLLGEPHPEYPTRFRFGAAGKAGHFNLSLPSTSEGVLTLSEPKPNKRPAVYQLLIEQEGYLPFTTTNILAQNGSQSLSVRLEKGAGPSGVVLSPNGEPAANAAVFICTPQAGVNLDGPAHVSRNINTSAYRAQTDKAGRFALAAAPDPRGLVAVHDLGYAQLSLAEFETAGCITLQPWGRIEGRLVLDSHGMPNETIRAVSQVFDHDAGGRRFALATVALQATTDAAGAFSFEKVPPGPCEIFWQKESPREPRSGFDSHEVSVMVKAGSVAQALLGGEGRPVTGVASFARPVNWLGIPVRLTSKLAADPGPRPKRADFQSDEEYRIANDRWFELNRSRRSFGAFCESTGAFRLSDIPAGTYELEVKLPDLAPRPLAPQDGRPQPAIASLTRGVVIPEIPGGHSDEALDLGILELEPRTENVAR